MTACKAADLEDHFRSRPLPELSAVSLVVMNESERYTKEISGPDQKSLCYYSPIPNRIGHEKRTS